MSKAMTEFDQWVVCPKCLSAMVGEVGEKCIICKGKVTMQATPLMQLTPVSARITAKVLHDAKQDDKFILAELGIEYTPEEQELLIEMGLG